MTNQHRPQTKKNPQNPRRKNPLKRQDQAAVQEQQQN